MVSDVLNYHKKRYNLYIKSEKEEEEKQ